MADVKTPEESFRSSLEDLVAIAGALAPCCDSVADLVGMIELALTNDGQLKTLMTLVKMTGARKR